MSSQYALVVTTLNPDFTDEAGFTFPISGHIYCEGYDRDYDILHGFHGTLWGQFVDNIYVNDCENGIWAVVKVDYNDDLFYIDHYSMQVKFKKGYVLHMVHGEDRLEECLGHIAVHRLERRMPLNPTFEELRYVRTIHRDRAILERELIEIEA